MSRGAVRCLEVLKRFARGKKNCWPEQAQLARAMDCSERAVRNYLNELRDAGRIVSKRRPNSSCMYELVDDFAVPEAERQKTVENSLCFAVPERQICRSTISSLTEETTKLASFGSAKLTEQIRDYLGEFPLHGEPASDFTIARIAAILGGQEAFALFKLRMTPELFRRATSWGLIVLKARDARADWDRAIARREEPARKPATREIKPAVAHGWHPQGTDYLAAEVSALAAQKALRRHS